MSETRTYAESEPRQGGQTGRTLPRLLAGTPAHGGVTLEEHEALRGPLPEVAPPRASRARRREPSPLYAEVEAAALRGRGGAGFPSAAKLLAVAGARGTPVVVVNGTEGEPASTKDRTLLEAQPHLVLDGAELAAEAVGAQEVVVAVCELAVSTVETLTAAIEEREAFASPDAVRFGLELVPGHYVAGQETALVNHINGGPAVPAFTPPRVYEAGVGKRPTLVNNPETLANVALIARYGPDWFRELGTAAEPGSVLVTVSGPVAQPGVYEIELGTPMSSLLAATGRSEQGVRAALIGGYAGTWLDASELAHLRLADEFLASLDASLGAGVILLLSDEACPVAETARLARWLSSQSARQCGPCEHGLDALASTIEALAAGRAPQQARARLERLAELTAGRGACTHPDGAVRTLMSALHVFWDEVGAHAARGPCEACARPSELPLPGRPVRKERPGRNQRRWR